MNKAIAVLCLFMIIPAIGMEKQIVPKIMFPEHQEKLQSYSFLVTSEENKKFADELARRLDFCKTVTANSKYVHQGNPIYKMIEKLSQDFNECHNDVLELIAHKELGQRITMYEQECNSNDVVVFCLTQIDRRIGDVAAARYHVGKSREMLAEKKLSTLRIYDVQPLGDLQIQDRIDYMKANTHYPTNDQAVKDFMALFIYRSIFAHQTHKK